MAAIRPATGNTPALPDSLAVDLDVTVSIIFANASSWLPSLYKSKGSFGTEGQLLYRTDLLAGSAAHYFDQMASCPPLLTASIGTASSGEALPSLCSSVCTSDAHSLRVAVTLTLTLEATYKFLVSGSFGWWNWAVGIRESPFPIAGANSNNPAFQAALLIYTLCAFPVSPLVNNWGDANCGAWTGPSGHGLAACTSSNYLQNCALRCTRLLPWRVASSAGQSCTTVCNSQGLLCDEADQAANNYAVDSASDLISVLTNLLGRNPCTTSGHPTGVAGTASDVPNYKANGDCYYSSPGRTSSQFNCAAPHHDAHRLCYCSSPPPSPAATTSATLLG